MQSRISMITVGVRDIATSVKFYQEGLGFPKIETSPDVAFFNLSGTWLGLFGRDELAKDANVPSSTAGFSGVALAHNVTSEDEVDAVLAHAVSVGATLTKPAQKTDWGGYSGYFSDLDGHLWEVAHNHFEWIGPPDERA